MSPWGALWFILVVVILGLGLFMWWRRSSVYGQGSQAQQVTAVTKVQAPVYPPPPAVESPREIPIATADYPVSPDMEKCEESEQMREERLLEGQQMHQMGTAPEYPPPAAVESPQRIPTATADYPVFPGLERHFRRREELEQLREERLLEREHRHHLGTAPVYVYASPPPPQAIPTATVVSDLPEAKPVPPSNVEGAVSYSP